MSYDYNGNIKFLKRYEHGILKIITYIVIMGTS